MDRIIVRAQVSIKVLLIIVGVIGFVLGGSLFWISWESFKEQETRIERLIAQADWEAVETELAAAKERTFFTKRTAYWELKYLYTENLEKNDKIKAMKILRSANYLYVHSRAQRQWAQEVLGEIYYQLGKDYSPQAYVYLHEKLKTLSPAELNNKATLPLYQKLYTVCIQLDKITEALAYGNKLIELDSERYEQYIMLAQTYLSEKNYENVITLLEKVLFAKQTPSQLLQKSALMLFAVALHLNLNTKADFYRQYALSKRERLVPIPTPAVKRAWQQLFKDIRQASRETDIETLLARIDSLEPVTQQPLNA